MCLIERTKKDFLVFRARSEAEYNVLLIQRLERNWAKMCVPRVIARRRKRNNNKKDSKTASQKLNAAARSRSRGSGLFKRIEETLLHKCEHRSRVMCLDRWTGGFKFMSLTLPRLSSQNSCFELLFFSFFAVECKIRVSESALQSWYDHFEIWRKQVLFVFWFDVQLRN